LGFLTDGGPLQGEQLSYIAIIDSGSYKTIMDTMMAKQLGMEIRSAVDGDCGTYSVPGTG
jgi:hypothetical protein